MTRARYFLLVAWTYQRLEKQRIGSAQINERARRAETDLIDAIEQSDDSDGNIGTLARTALKRLPSNIYWRGSGCLGHSGVHRVAGTISPKPRSVLYAAHASWRPAFGTGHRAR